ncbi:uncharacterized protein LOC107712301 [Sinocyclocheilus rhinocerous]|uniref:uncharacterized protein LOC107712301 n=1 Tax=Sinocyclocheilus rhinocerous TaxID=307959 RepID=UPI0007B86B99|nr:PREDICTED: uncharacterized protein LOC107712301 [Sinocyclocheilus rhinocerous]
MSNNPRVFDDPSKVRGHMAAEISNALLREAKAAMAMESSAIPQKRKRTRRKKSVTSRREKRQRAQSPALASEVTGNPVCEEVPQIEDPELTASLETRLQELKGTLTSVEYPVATEKTVWAQRQVFADVRAKTARPVLLDAKLSAERVIEHICNKCHAGEAVIRCLDCVPLDTEFLCGSCDIAAHKKNVFHNRRQHFMATWSLFPLQRLWC